jgi:hypothetical protein
MAKAYQVLKFVLVDFDGDWNRIVGNIYGHGDHYKATKTGRKLAVVREGPTGVATTYWFEVAVDDEVHMFRDVIHIPNRCMKQDAGITVKCRKG